MRRNRMHLDGRITNHNDRGFIRVNRQNRKRLVIVETFKRDITTVFGRVRQNMFRMSFQQYDLKARV